MNGHASNSVWFWFERDSVLGMLGQLCFYYALPFGLCFAILYRSRLWADRTWMRRTLPLTSVAPAITALGVAAAITWCMFVYSLRLY